MANKNNHVVIAYFSDADQAQQAADQIKDWDKANDAIKLGGIGILTWEKGKIKTHKVGRRATGTGAKWGVALGAVTGVLSGGVTLIGGVVAGAAGGAVMGALFHKSLGLSDGDKAGLEEHLQIGGAALVVMADEDEVEPTEAELAALGGDVENYQVPDEVMSQIEEAEDVQPVEEEADSGEEGAEATAEPEATAVEEEGVAVEEEPVPVEEVVAAVNAAIEASPQDMTKFSGPLTYLEGIGSTYAVSLKGIGINTPRALLEQGASRKGRAEIAEKSGISPRLILRWVHYVDLFRVRGVGHQYARLLDAASVDTVPELAQRNPEHLQASLASVNAEKHLVHEVPGLSQTQNWVAQAQGLPRVVTYYSMAPLEP